MDTRATSTVRAAVWLAFALAGCAYRQNVAIESAGNLFKCPEKQIVVKDLGDNNFRAAGCGKEETLYCDYVVQNEYTAQQHSEIVCRPVKQALEEAQRTRQVADACAEMCNRGAMACNQGCEDTSCRNACSTLADGCMKGCVSSQQ
jgi:hypothetical protein